MIIEQLSAYTNGDLVATATVEAELGVAPGSGLPIARWIDAASAVILGLCDPIRLSLYAKWRETLPGSGRDKLLLAKGPIKASPAPAVTYDGEAVTGWAVDPDLNGLVLTDAYTGGYTFTRQPIMTAIGIRSLETDMAVPEWQVTYEAGYVPESQTGLTETLPADVKQAALQLIVGWWRAYRRDPSVKSESVGNLSVTYSDEGGEVPPVVLALLAPYMV